MADSPPPMDFEEEAEATAEITETVEEPQAEEPTPAATLPTDSGEDSTTAAKPESSTALLEPTSTDDLPEEEVVHSKPISAPAPAKSKVHDLFDDDDDEDDEPPATEQQVKVYITLIN